MTSRTSNWSLRVRLVWISTLALVAAMVLGGIAMYWAATIEENQMLDSRLEHLGATILSFVEEELEEELHEVSAEHHSLPLKMKTRASATLLYRFQVWTRHGTLLMRSNEASADTPLMALQNLGYGSIEIDGETHRTFALPTSNGELVVQVAENNEERLAQTGKVAGYYMGFLLLPFGCVVGATWLMFRHSLHSLESLANQLRHRTSQDLTNVVVDKPPQELLPILKAVDMFFERMRGALSVERRFTSVAAHEMRTPLAGLRAHAQLAATADNPMELGEALDAVMVGVDRATHLLEQLLDLARVEGLEQHEGLDVSVDVAAVYQSVLASIRPLKSARQLVFQDDFQVPTVVCAEFGLRLLLGNLLGNAALYTPDGGQVNVSTADSSAGVALTVDDSGPGIPASSRQRAFERFDRLGRTNTDGVGLGLSIVRSIVQIHGASIELLDSPLGGLRVLVVFRKSKAESPQ